MRWRILASRSLAGVFAGVVLIVALEAGTALASLRASRVGVASAVSATPSATPREPSDQATLAAPTPSSTTTPLSAPMLPSTTAPPRATQRTPPPLTSGPTYTTTDGGYTVRYPARFTAVPRDFGAVAIGYPPLPPPGPNGDPDPGTFRTDIEVWWNVARMPLSRYVGEWLFKREVLARARVTIGGREAEVVTVKWTGDAMEWRYWFVPLASAERMLVLRARPYNGPDGPSAEVIAAGVSFVPLGPTDLRARTTREQAIATVRAQRELVSADRIDAKLATWETYWRSFGDPPGAQPIAHEPAAPVWVVGVGGALSYAGSSYSAGIFAVDARTGARLHAAFSAPAAWPAGYERLPGR